MPFISQVILGSNGSGKSTVLKLIARLYDPTEGTILIDEQDIRTLRMEDLRRALTILFQDYTLFPLTVSLLPHVSFPDPRLADTYTYRLEKISPLVILLEHMIMPR